MKKVSMLLILLTMLALVGCGEKEEESTPFTLSGVFESYTQDESGYVVTISNDTGFQSVRYEPDTQNSDTIVSLDPGCEITLTGVLCEDSLYLGRTVSVDSVPLETQLGYNGYDLMSFEYDYTYSSLLAQASFDYTISQAGRQYHGRQENSYYLDQDENAMYFSSIYKNILDGVEKSSSIMWYVDRNTHDEYILENYGTWRTTAAESVDYITFAIDSGVITVEEFSMEGDRVCVKGTVNTIPNDSYLDYLLDDLFSRVGINKGNLNVSFLAKFDAATKLVKYAEYTISADTSYESNEGVVTIDNMVLTLSGIDFNNEEAVVIPEYAKSVVPDVPDTSTQPEEGEGSMSEIIPLCQTWFGMSADQLTVEYVSQIIGDPYSNEEIVAECNPDDVVTAAMDILSWWSIEQFTQAQNADGLTVEQVFAIAGLSEHMVMEDTNE